MYVKMIGVYGKQNMCAWYRKNGDGCFGFTTKKELATPLTISECNSIIENAEWYCLQFSADRLVIDQ